MRPPMQIMEGVLLRTGENEITLTCTDGSLSVRATVSACVEEEGEVVLPGRLTAEMARKLPEGTVSVTMNDKLVVTVRCRQSRSTLTGMSATDFPEMKDLTETFGLHLPQKRLREMINKTVFAIAQQESRPALTGCLMEVTKSEMRLVGLDGFRLALQRVHEDFVLPDGKEQISAIIPGHVMSEMARIMTDEDIDVTFHMDATHLMAVMGKTTLVTALLAGEYIDYKQILPTAWLSRVTVKKDELMDAIDRASLIAREGKNNLIRLSASGDVLRITSVSEMGDVLEELGMNLQGDEIEIAFNAKYLGDIVKNVDDECLTMSMNTNVSPCVISPVSGDSFLYLVLPMRVYN